MKKIGILCNLSLKEIKWEVTYMPDLNKVYFIKEIIDFKDFITVTYVIIDDIYQRVTPAHIKFRCNINDSKMSDSEIITISIVGELLTIDSENAWYKFCKRNFKDLFPTFCDRTRFNRTKRNLHSIIEQIRKEICRLMGCEDQLYRVIDSIPIPVCKFGRAHFHTTFKGFGAAYGRCASKKETYYGYKLHLLIALNGLVTDLLLTPANIDDRAAALELLSAYRNITVLGDKGYTGDEFTKTLKRRKGIIILPLKKNSDKLQFSRTMRRTIFRFRRRIETSGSQLSGQLNIERVLAKSLWGLLTRIKVKLLAFDLCFFINKLMGCEEPARIKGLIFG
jgi:hypothetical protein